MKGKQVALAVRPFLASPGEASAPEERTRKPEAVRPDVPSEWLEQVHWDSVRDVLQPLALRGAVSARALFDRSGQAGARRTRSAPNRLPGLDRVREMRTQSALAQIFQV